MSGLNKKVLIHRENKEEWRYIGIWADSVSARRI